MPDPEKFEMEGVMSRFSIDRANMTDEEKRAEEQKEKQTILNLTIQEPPTKRSVPIEVVEMIIRILLRESRP